MQHNMDTIIFENKKFKTRDIDLPEHGTVTISTSSLNNLLLSENDKYISDEAISIDEKIFYFVQDHEIEFEAEKLIELITQEIL